MRLEAPLLLVGCGKMGGALVAGWLARGLDPRQVTVVEPNREAAEAVAAKGATAVSALDDCAPDFAPGVVVFAIKPQQMAGALPAYRALVRPQTVFLSIAAGTTIGFFEGHLGGAAAIVRAMPNTPAAIGRGMSVLCANANVGAAQRATCEALMAGVGEVAWVDDEALLDPVTAVSGSGPAYVFLLIETLARAGVEAGLPEDLATRLARETVAGAGELARGSSESATTLRENVTSPGGTTEAALAVLMDKHGLQELMTRAVAAASRRSRDLSS